MRKMATSRNTQFWINFKEWVSYWRLNIHRFVLEYMGVNIHLFQQIILYLMDSPNCNSITSFIFFASRGLGKTFITMVFCIAKSILYPGIKIKVASSTIKQSNLFLNKVYEIMNGRPNIEKEIESISIGKELGVIKFYNG